MADSVSPMIFRLLTPAGAAAEAECDYVQLSLRDGAREQGGGLVGIQRNHAPAVMALGKGTVLASLAGAAVFRADVAGGFALVKNNTVTVITDSVSAEEEPAARQQQTRPGIAGAEIFRQ